MIYELRVYDAAPGQMRALHSRFTEDGVHDAFIRHGIKVVGYWTYEIGPGNTLVYILGFDDLADRERKWKAFGSDPAFTQAMQKWAKEPTVINRITNWIMNPTAYSPMK